MSDRSLSRRLWVSAAVAAGLLSGAAHAQSIKLQPFTEASGHGEETKIITGRCRDSVARVIGVTRHGDESFALEQGIVVVRSAPADDLLLTERLSDHNGLACSLTPAGHGLVLWSKCGGSGCPDRWDYTVVDPEKLKVLAPAGRRDGCNRACAPKHLGGLDPVLLSGR